MGSLALQRLIANERQDRPPTSESAIALLAEGSRGIRLFGQRCRLVAFNLAITSVDMESK